MDYDEFVNQAQNRLEHPSKGPTVRSIRAVLTVLGERLHPSEAKDLASCLPMEIDRFLTEADSGQRFDYQECVERVSDIEESDPPDAAYHVQQIVDLMSETVPPGELDDVRNSLPEDFDDMFELVDAAQN